MKRLLLSLALGTLLVLVAAPAHAQNAFGLRGGATLDPDQIHFGFHMRPPELTPNVRIRPSLEIGLGDDFTIGAFNLDLVYEFESESVRPFAGAGRE